MNLLALEDLRRMWWCFKKGRIEIRTRDYHLLLQRPAVNFSQPMHPAKYCQDLFHGLAEKMGTLQFLCTIKLHPYCWREQPVATEGSLDLMSYAQVIYDAVRATRSTAVERHSDVALLVVRDQLHVALAIERSLRAPVLKDSVQVQPVAGSSRLPNQPPTKGAQNEANGAGPTKTPKTQNTSTATTKQMQTHAAKPHTQKTVTADTQLTSKRAIDEVGGVLGVPENAKRSRLVAATTVPPAIPTAPARKTKNTGKQRAEPLLQTPSHGGGARPAPTQHQLAETSKAQKNAQKKTAMAEGTVPQKSKLIVTTAKGDARFGCLISSTSALNADGLYSGSKVPGLKRSAETAELDIPHVAKKLVKLEVYAEPAPGRSKRKAASAATVAIKNQAEDREKAQKELVAWAAEAADMKHLRQRLAASARTPEPSLANSVSNSPSLSQDARKAITESWVREEEEWVMEVDSEEED
ncbi:hypothetical protein K438DRAFT_1753141 [Mycena galopus ATCC 62051]|nr:hypothetical protein K438DRAFT_1753141 [Mycena galopus ATCC 62051]